MKPSDFEIISYCQQTNSYYEDNWGFNKMLSKRYEDDNIKKVLLTTQVLTKNFNRIDKIYICHTSDSTGLLYGLKKTFDCQIVVLTNHPLFERMHDYYDETLFGIDYQKFDCMFDNPFKIINNADVVLFPDMEYYVPLKYKRFTNVKSPVCCTYYVDDLNAVTEPNLIDKSDEIMQLFSFKETKYLTATKTITGRHCYCGLGTL